MERSGSRRLKSAKFQNFSGQLPHLKLHEILCPRKEGKHCWKVNLWTWKNICCFRSRCILLICHQLGSNRQPLDVKITDQRSINWATQSSILTCQNFYLFDPPHSSPPSLKAGGWEADEMMMSWWTVVDAHIRTLLMTGCRCSCPKGLDDAAVPRWDNAAVPLG